MIVFNFVAIVALLGLLAWCIPELVRDTRDLATAVVSWIRVQQDERARTARRIQELQDETNETITRLQLGYWEAQRRMREELDTDE